MATPRRKSTEVSRVVALGAAVDVVVTLLRLGAHRTLSPIVRAAVTLMRLASPQLGRGWRARPGYARWGRNEVWTS